MLVASVSKINCPTVLAALSQSWDVQKRFGSHGLKQMFSANLSASSRIWPCQPILEKIAGNKCVVLRNFLAHFSCIGQSSIVLIFVPSIAMPLSEKCSTYQTYFWKQVFLGLGFNFALRHLKTPRSYIPWGHRNTCRRLCHLGRLNDKNFFH